MQEKSTDSSAKPAESPSGYAVGSPYAVGTLPLDGLHTMHYEESGSPTGRPVVYLHGGPGAGIEPAMRAVHDPQAYRFVMFDQRGAGRSTPAGELRDNTTWHLVADIERLREHLGIERWIVSGGSWGTTLALAYAQRHPERCEALVLRGVWLSTEPELRWFQRGLRNFYPEVWKMTVGDVSADNIEGHFDAWRARILDPDPAIAGPAAVAKARYEWLCCMADPGPEELAQIDAELTLEYCLPYQRIGAHYRNHDFFLEPGQLLRDVHLLSKVPGFIVNGRLDMVCPPIAAYRLQQAWPRAELRIVPGAGHFCTEPGIVAALLGIMERLK
jgi:proline iminopeptidase